MTLLPSVAFLCVLAAVGEAAAECDAADPTLCATYIAKGQAAPFDGQLLTPPLAIKLGQKADGCEAWSKLEVDLAAKLAAVDLELERRLRRIEADEHARITSALREALSKAQGMPPIYERPWFVGTATAVLAVTGFTLAVWGAGQLR